MGTPAVERAAQLVWEDDCIMTQRRIRMGYGYMHNEPDTVPMGSSMKAFGHTGTGGAFAWCDRERNLAFAYCTNFQREGPGIGPRGAALGVAEPGVLWKRLLRSVGSYADLEPPLVGAVEQLIDFVTLED